ncbi:bifunctional diaminohydroxyphosphoribosylaminopyrimidine deaminase/5-amino-6-(5-phosphoribosylamino)uracil reductase RibD [Acidiferrobacter sp.]|uniref:bifunctional diaminohydroxyphosphoribosylaminopyrimidine deaminase/5-amino-6-(5-phosphoribosylamino)uracil reductase RibD n=1 Tax=Acidiferrobacter sp. TaxID=1872107 RepID=UPI00261986B9|nr:bifunctional diaminohydroxyphosphoribosylaminopyrimidine deaminase/5-amino-6-(5-phosphoribosylamino)uracil reductase RibD [Acidiferrobacter sp.]
MSAARDAALMARALELARQGMATTHPNPRVGCVIVRDDEVVGEGYHVRAGEPHAERLALAQAGDRARGATAYVTLEPCCHTGRTPPCTEALLTAGVARVVAAMEDPDARVRGRGFAMLRAAGVTVDVGLMKDEAARLNRGFLSRTVRARPFVIAKAGISLDGRTALASGESRWITGPEARADVQRLRAVVGAVMTGAGTVRQDDPRLTVHAGTPRQPLRVVVSSRPAIPPAARILARDAGLLVLTVADGPDGDVLRGAGAEVVAVGGTPGRVDLAAGLAALAARGINDVLVEAGPTLMASLLAARLIDELRLYIAPTLLGNGRPLADFALSTLSSAYAWRYDEVRSIGRDLRLILTPET